MKNQLTLTNALSWTGLMSAVAGLMLLGTAASSSAATEVLAPSSLPYGFSYEEWSGQWWQWSLGQATNNLELVGEPAICAGPASHVRFLEGVYLPGTGGLTTQTRHITIGPEASLFFPVLSAWVDNSGCPFTSFTADELTAQAVAQWSAVTVTTCTIDGVEVAGMEDPTNSVYNVVSPAFSYTTAEKHNVLAGFFGDACVPGGMTIYPAVADGVYVMLSPLRAGKHTIHFVGVVGPVSAPYVKNDITYDITVLPAE